MSSFLKYWTSYKDHCTLFVIVALFSSCLTCFSIPQRQEKGLYLHQHVFNQLFWNKNMHW
jgi:hypothetical protein